MIDIPLPHIIFLPLGHFVFIALAVKMDFTCLLKKSQLHGISRLSEKEDRLIWIIALLLGFGAATAATLIALRRFESNPTFVTRKDYGRYKMEFPSVLICPELDFPEVKMEQFLDDVNIPLSLNRSYFKSVLRQLGTYYSLDVPYTVEDLDNINMLLDYNGIGLEHAVFQLLSTCEEMLLRCRWRGVIKDCTQLFQMETMQYGVCCVYNGRSLKRELQLKQLPIKVPKITAYTDSSGFSSGLAVAVNQAGLTNLRSVGLSYKWAIIDGPQRFVDGLNFNGTALSPGTEVWLGYKTSLFETTEDSKTLSLDLRQCVFAHTRLTYFPIYKRHYCRTECEVRNVIRKCNCTMPTHPTLTSTLCEPKSVLCAKHVARQTNLDNCNCLPPCDTLNADIDVTTNNLSSEHIPVDHFYKDLNFNEVTILRVFIHERQIANLTRRSYFTATDLFAQMGGIFGVFFGCSVLSMLEILQLIWYGYRNWFGAKRTNTKEKTASVPTDKDKTKTKKSKFIVPQKMKRKKINNKNT